MMQQPETRVTSHESLTVAAEYLRTMAHPHRLRMIQMLRQGEFTVGELADACELPSPMASEHLRLMQRSGLLDSRREGRKVFYYIADPYVSEILSCIEMQYGTGK